MKIAKMKINTVHEVGETGETSPEVPVCWFALYFVFCRWFLLFLFLQVVPPVCKSKKKRSTQDEAKNAKENEHQG